MRWGMTTWSNSPVPRLENCRRHRWVVEKPGTAWKILSRAGVLRVAQEDTSSQEQRQKQQQEQRQDQLPKSCQRRVDVGHPQVPRCAASHLGSAGADARTPRRWGEAFEFRDGVLMLARRAVRWRRICPSVRGR
jgi:hypothetical protein